MDTTELCFTPATELAAAIRARKLSPVEIADAVLARIEALNPRLNAYLTVDADGARAAARAAEAAVMRGGDAAAARRPADLDQGPRARRAACAAPTARGSTGTTSPRSTASPPSA